MKVAAYQAPLLAAGSMGALDLITARVRACEAEGVAILCCPEAILGGLADQIEDPARLAISVRTGQLEAVLAPLASDVTTTIVGFTELGEDGRLYNAAAVFHRGTVGGVYRKLHPAIRQSVYRAGCHVPVFRVGALTFGIVICNDSNFPELANQMASRGATVLFVPSNNALSPQKGGAEIVAEARRVDVATAIANGIWVIRADVAGQTAELTSHGSSAIVDPKGTVVRTAAALSEDVMAAAIEVASRIAGPALVTALCLLSGCGGAKGTPSTPVSVPTPSAPPATLSDLAASVTSVDAGHVVGCTDDVRATVRLTNNAARVVLVTAVRKTNSTGSRNCFGGGAFTFTLQPRLVEGHSTVTVMDRGLYSDGSACCTDPPHCRETCTFTETFEVLTELGDVPAGAFSFDVAFGDTCRKCPDASPSASAATAGRACAPRAR